ncbi:patatin-like phospholipase RssA [Algibacillus agarilyticus]|uniref:patatin-like phospholipase RssA n=1 Tax=Algibacillus agarilyticus TaxID=2234133 RepID=UPI000DD0B1F6|nr:patatin-like phospholipase RssA [Algibacillus agarilyticus]
MTNKTKKIGLVLGSGAAKGWTHIGIINALHEMGVKPDVIVGCSMGSLVGGALAAGKFDEISQWATSMDSWRIVKLLDWGVNRGGLVAGEKVFSHFQQMIGDLNIQDCDIPFATLATELYTGREHWLQSGRLVDAVRASCAMPGVLAPYLLDDHWLIDGAVVNPVPVSLCRAMGATHIIAVNVNSGIKKMRPDGKSPLEQVLQTQMAAEVDPEMKDRHTAFSNLLGSGKNWFANRTRKTQHDLSAPNVWGVVAGSIDIMQDRLTRARLAGEPPEVLIQPNLAHIGILEFNRAAELIEIGEKAVAPFKPILESWIE